MSSLNKHIKVIIAGGGTGGHIFPAVAIGHALKRLQPEASLLFVGAKGKMEMEKVPKEGFEIKGLDIAGFDRSSMLKNISLPIKLIKSFLQAYKILKQFKPDVVVGVGGYASFPCLKIAQLLNIKTLLQEQNSFAGKSNKILGKKADAICVAYDAMERFFPKEKIIKTGNPVRQQILNTSISSEQAKQFFGLNPKAKTIFVFGGSLGAKSINEAILSHADFFNDDLQLLWQTGSTFFNTAKQALDSDKNIKINEFIYDMDKAYAAADIIVARAGASSIAELCIVGKPVIFIPFPFASEDHQTHNALALVKKQAARMIENKNTNTQLFSVIKELLLNPEAQATMSSEIKKMAITHADVHIAQTILNLNQN
ncbi:MAG: undecaprenyldiphospho-muramoylpentapeptide beta-N-acetylglucosaminyltransferase [Chitinophagaceae bacterium]